MRGEAVPQDLAGQTVLIVGLGTIGTTLARYCRALGMRVIGVRRTPGRAVGAVDDVHAPTALPALLPRCEWVVLACPLTPETERLMNAGSLARLPRGARLINVARGGVVDEPALIEALEAGTIAGAALDVFAQEPLPSDSPLWKTKNLTLFPHLGGYSLGYEDRAMPTIEDNMRKYFAGDLKNMINIVRKPASWGD